MSCSGYYQLDEGQASCLQCPAGYACNSTAVTECLPGTVSSLGEMTCTECPQAYYQTEPANDTCLICPAGYSCTLSSITVCDPGYKSEEGQADCTACLQGFTLFHLS